MVLGEQLPGFLWCSHYCGAANRLCPPSETQQHKDLHWNEKRWHWGVTMKKTSNKGAKMEWTETQYFLCFSPMLRCYASLLRFALFWLTLSAMCCLSFPLSPLWKLGLSCTALSSPHIIFHSQLFFFLTANLIKGFHCSLPLPWTRRFSPRRMWRTQWAW